MIITILIIVLIKIVTIITMMLLIDLLEALPGTVRPRHGLARHRAARSISAYAAYACKGELGRLRA